MRRRKALRLYIKTLKHWTNLKINTASLLIDGRGMITVRAACISWLFARKIKGIFSVKSWMASFNRLQWARSQKMNGWKRENYDLIWIWYWMNLLLCLIIFMGLFLLGKINTIAETQCIPPVETQCIASLQWNPSVPNRGTTNSGHNQKIWRQLFADLKWR